MAPFKQTCMRTNLYEGGKRPLPEDPNSCPVPLCTCDYLKSQACQLCFLVIPTEGIWACSPQPLPSALGFCLESTVLANADFFKARVRRMHVQNHLPGVGGSKKWETCSFWRHLILLGKNLEPPLVYCLQAAKCVLFF